MGKWCFSGTSNYKKTAINPAHQKKIFGPVKMYLALVVDASYSWYEWQAVKLTFFAPCNSPGPPVYTVVFISLWYHRNGPLSLKLVKFNVIH